VKENLKRVSKGQTLLYKMLRSRFGGYNLNLNVKHADLKWPSSQRLVELDCFIPELSLAFEYQGETHFRSSTLYGSHVAVNKNDKQKKELCSDAGITLIDIPFWWDQTESSLLATLSLYRPDLSHNVDGTPISLSAPTTISKWSTQTTMKEPIEWKQGIQLSKQWMLFDGSGLHVLWTGNALLWNGKVVSMPSSIYHKIPRIPLQGHLRSEDPVALEEIKNGSLSEETWKKVSEFS
jgi:hypothetical protein